MRISSFSALMLGGAALALVCSLGGSPASAAQSESAVAASQAAADQALENSRPYGELAAQAEANAAQAVRQAARNVRAARLFAAQDTEDEGWLGVEIGDVTAQKAKDLKLSSERGVIVSSVAQESPAAKAGLKANDVILQYNGENVEGAEQFRRLVRETPPNRAATLEISREGKTQNLSVTLGDRADAESGQWQSSLHPLQNLRFAMPNTKWNNSAFASPDVFFMNAPKPVLGITAEDLSGQLGAYFGAPKDQGVLVRDVQSASPAAKAGLKAGDVIISAGGKPVKSLAGLREQLPARNLDKSVTLPLQVIRRGSQMTLSVTIEPPQRPEPPPAMHTAQL